MKKNIGLRLESLIIFPDVADVWATGFLKVLKTSTLSLAVNVIKEETYILFPRVSFQLLHHRYIRESVVVVANGMEIHFKM